MFRFKPSPLSGRECSPRQAPLLSRRRNSIAPLAPYRSHLFLCHCSLFPESCESLHIFSLKALSSFSGAQGALNTPPQRRLFSIVFGDIYSSASELQTALRALGKEPGPHMCTGHTVSQCLSRTNSFCQSNYTMRARGRGL